jgi:hypothetical protein
MNVKVGVALARHDTMIASGIDKHPMDTILRPSTQYQTCRETQSDAQARVKNRAHIQTQRVTPSPTQSKTISSSVNGDKNNARNNTRNNSLTACNILSIDSVFMFQRTTNPFSVPTIIIKFPTPTAMMGPCSLFGDQSCLSSRKIGAVVWPSALALRPVDRSGV